MTTGRGGGEGRELGLILMWVKGVGVLGGSAPLKVLVASREALHMSSSSSLTNPCDSRSIMIDKRLGSGLMLLDLHPSSTTTTTTHARRRTSQNYSLVFYVHLKTVSLVLKHLFKLIFFGKVAGLTFCI